VHRSSGVQLHLTSLPDGRLGILVADASGHGIAPALVVMQARTLVRTLKRLGYAVGIVSGGFTSVTADLVDDLGLDHALANELEVVDGRLTGRLLGRVVDRARKAEALRDFAAAEGLTISLGH